MHFTHVNDGSGNKAGKFAIVAGVHVLVGVLFVHSINTRHITLPKMTEQVLVLLQPEAPPPPPPEPPKPVPKVAPPDVVVPKVEVETPPPEVAPPVQAVTETEPPQEQAPVAPPAPEAPPADPSANTGAMRTAVLADGCATPEYPAREAREGIEGTVTLALLIGPDGKVSNSRVEHSSGSRGLDRAALNALSMCKFKPAMSNGVPQAGWGQIAYVWKLE